jgi:beta-glucosidase/6-phospho-beta-glucosidase/beta-galactosidase
MAKNLPKNFIWAAGNSAIQCEGNNIYSDWYYFEKNKPFSKSG